MDVEEAICIWLLHRRLKQRKRRHWVNPMLQNRLTQGLFATLYPTLRENEEKFSNYFRMSMKLFDDLLAVIKDDISSTNTVLRDSICPEQKLVITLRYLATGCSIIDLHDGYRLGRSTISGILRQVCAAIWARLKPIHMPEMTKEKWEEVAKGFEKYTNFPNCIGAIAGKHISRVQPGGKGYPFYNKKSVFSTVLLAVCDANHSIIYLDIGEYGNTDSATFTQSSMYKKLVENALDIPEPKLISACETTCLPHVIVGDEAFGLMKNVMRPYSGKHLTYKKKIFNYRLSRVQRYIECTFGILANEWHIFQRRLNVNIDFAEDILKTCCILHNYIHARNGFRYEDTFYRAPMIGLHKGYVPRGCMSATSARDKYADYFINEGKLEWQDKMI